MISSALEASSEYILLSQSISKHEEAIKILQAHLGPLAYDAKKRGILTQDHKLRTDEFLKKLKDVEKSKISLIAKLNDLKETENEGPAPFVSWSSTMYSGVTIRHHEIDYIVSGSQKGPKSITFDKEKKEFQEVTYQEIKLTEKEEKNGKR